jgi:hypothetical protein
MELHLLTAEDAEDAEDCLAMRIPCRSITWSDVISFDGTRFTE